MKNKEMIDLYCHERGSFLANHKVKWKMPLGTKMTKKDVTSSLPALALMYRENVGKLLQRLALELQDSSSLRLSMDSRRK